MPRLQQDHFALGDARLSVSDVTGCLSVHYCLVFQTNRPTWFLAKDVYMSWTQVDVTFVCADHTTTLKLITSTHRAINHFLAFIDAFIDFLEVVHQRKQTYRKFGPRCDWPRPSLATLSQLAGANWRAVEINEVSRRRARAPDFEIAKTTIRLYLASCPIIPVSVSPHQRRTGFTVAPT
jgi:hypothetical protein